MADFHPDNPLIVQGDHTVLVEVDNPLADRAVLNTQLASTVLAGGSSLTPRASTTLRP